MTNIRKHIKQVLREESYSDLKKPFMKYEKLINKLVYEVFDEGICGFDWEVVQLHERKGLSIRFVLHFTKNSYKEFDYQRYADAKQELKEWIEDYLPKFNGIFIAYDTTKCDQNINESELPIQIRRRVNKIDKLVDVMLNDMYVDEYDSEQEFFDGVVFELGWLVRNEDFELHDVEWSDIFDYINEYRSEDIKEYYRERQKDEINETELTERCWKGYTQKGMKTMFGKRYPNCVKIKKKKSLRESIKNILDEQVTKKYSKPNEKVDKLVYKWLDDYFEGSQMYKKESWKYYSFHFEFCKNGREIAELNVRFDDKSPDFGPKDKRPTNERSVDEVWLYIYPDMIDEILTYIPIRKNYLLYLIEEWFEDTKLDEIQRGFNRNDLSLDYIFVSESKKKGELCVPSVPKPENISMKEMQDLIKKNTLYSYKDMDKHEEEEPGWIEDTYMGILQNQEHKRVNDEDRDSF